MASKTLYARIAEATKQAKRVPKSGHNSFHGYSFATESDISDAMRDILSSTGIAVVCSGPEPSLFTVEDAGTTRSGQPRYRYRVWMQYHVVNVDDPEDQFSAWAVGEAIDQEDKGHNKAMTNARKYFLINTFNISTGDDPDHDSPSRDQNDGHQAEAQSEAAAPGEPEGMGEEFASKLRETLRDNGISMKDLRDELKNSEKNAALLKGKMTKPELWPEELRQPVKAAIVRLASSRPSEEANEGVKALGKENYGKLIAALSEAQEKSGLRAEDGKMQDVALRMIRHADNYPGESVDERVDGMVKAIANGSVHYPSGDFIPF